MKGPEKDFSLWFLFCITFRHAPEVAQTSLNNQISWFYLFVKVLILRFIAIHFQEMQHFICDFHCNDVQKHQPRCYVNAEQGSWSQVIDICPNYLFSHCSCSVLYRCPFLDTESCDNHVLWVIKMDTAAFKIHECFQVISVFPSIFCSSFHYSTSMPST